MTPNTRPALDWARSQTAGSPIRWKALELSAFSAHPRIVRALGPTREQVEGAGRRPRAPWWAFALIPAVLATVMVIFYPALVFVLLAHGDSARFDVTGIDANVAIPVAGSILLVGGACHLIAILRRRQREKQQSTADFVAIFFGLADAVEIAHRGSEDGVTASPAWLIAALLVVAVGIVGFALGRRLPRQAKPFDDGPRPEPRRLVAKLSEADRVAIRTDLVAAIDDLAARGLISAETADRARGAELAMLSIAVSSERDAR